MGVYPWVSDPGGRAKSKGTPYGGIGIVPKAKYSYNPKITAFGFMGLIELPMFQFELTMLAYQIRGCACASVWHKVGAGLFFLEFRC